MTTLPPTTALYADLTTLEAATHETLLLASQVVGEMGVIHIRLEGEKYVTHGQLHWQERCSQIKKNLQEIDKKLSAVLDRMSEEIGKENQHVG